MRGEPATKSPPIMNDIMNVALGMLLLPALTFVLVYPLALTRLPGVDSSYPKADVSKRIMAGAIDAMLFGCALYFWANAGSSWFVVRLPVGEDS